MGGGKSAGQGKGQREGNRPGRNSRNRHGRHSGGGCNRGQQRHHDVGSVLIYRDEAKMLPRNALGGDGPLVHPGGSLYCIGGWTREWLIPAMNLETNRSDIRTPFKRRDRPPHLSEVGVTSEGPALTRQAAHSIFPGTANPIPADALKAVPPVAVSALEGQFGQNADSDANDPSEPAYALYSPAEVDTSADRLTEYTPRCTYPRSPVPIHRWLDKIPRPLVNAAQLDPSVLTAGRINPAYTSIRKAEA